MLEAIVSCLQVDPSTLYDFDLSTGKRVTPKWHRIYPVYTNNLFSWVYSTLRMTYSKSMNVLQAQCLQAQAHVFNIAMTQSTLSLKNYHVFSNPQKQRDLPCKIILRAFLNYYLFLNCIIFVKRHDCEVSQIILFQHKNAKNLFKKKTNQPNKQVGCK